MKYVTTNKDITKSRHFAALLFDCIHIPGDERSRTNPGHGYPSENKHIVQYIAFESETEMKGWIERVTKENRDYKILLVQPLDVEITMSVTVNA